MPVPIAHPEGKHEARTDMAGQVTGASSAYRRSGGMSQANARRCPFGRALICRE